MEQVPDDVRGITGVCESRLSEGAFLRAEVQGAEGGQDAGGLQDIKLYNKLIYYILYRVQKSSFEI